MIIASIDEDKVKNAFAIGITPKKILNYFCQNFHACVLKRKQKEILKFDQIGDGVLNNRKRGKNKNSPLQKLLPENIVEILHLWFEEHKIRNKMAI